MLRYSVHGLALSFAAILLAYLLLSVRYVIARPTISHNYIADINRESQAVPPDDRAWPLYRQALLQLPKAGRPGPLGWQDDAEVEKSWPEITAFLDEHEETLALVRQAASRPRLGFIYGDPENREFLQEFGRGAGQHGESPARYHPFLIACALPQHQEMRFLARVLDADTISTEGAADSDGDWVLWPAPDEPN